MPMDMEMAGLIRELRGWLKRIEETIEGAKFTIADIEKKLEAERT